MYAPLRHSVVNFFRGAGRAMPGQAAGGVAKIPWRQRLRKSIANQFSASSWRDAGSAASNFARSPIKTLRRGAKESYSGGAGAIGLGLLGLEAANMVSSKVGPVGKKKELLRREFGEGAPETYKKLRQERDAAIYGHGGQRMGTLMGGEAMALAAAARKVRFLPGLALVSGGAVAGNYLGKVVDKIRGKRVPSGVEASNAIRRYETANAIVSERRRDIALREAIKRHASVGR